MDWDVLNQITREVDKNQVDSNYYILQALLPLPRHSYLLRKLQKTLMDRPVKASTQILGYRRSDQFQGVCGTD